MLSGAVAGHGVNSSISASPAPRLKSGEGGFCITPSRARVLDSGGMHEMGIVAEGHAIARAAADARGGGPLESVTILVGELSAVEPDLLEFAWRAFVSGGADESAALVVDFRRARQICAECGEISERAPGSWLRLCPRCGRALAVRGGDELEVRSVSFSEGRVVTA